MTVFSWIIVLFVLWLATKFIDYKWKKEGTQVPYPMRKMALVLFFVAATFLVFTADKKKTDRYTASSYTGQIVNK